MADQVACLNCTRQKRATGSEETVYVEPQSSEVVTTKNNRQMLKGTCPNCGKGVNKFLPNK